MSATGLPPFSGRGTGKGKEGGKEGGREGEEEDGEEDGDEPLDPALALSNVAGFVHVTGEERGGGRERGREGWRKGGPGPAGTRRERAGTDSLPPSRLHVSQGVGEGFSGKDLELLAGRGQARAWIRHGP